MICRAGHSREHGPAIFGRGDRVIDVGRASGLCIPPGRLDQARRLRSMWTVLLILLVAWVVLSIVGFVFQGLLWLAIIGIVLFVGTLIFGIIRQRAGRAKA